MSYLLMPILVRYQGWFPKKIQKEIENISKAVKDKFIEKRVEYQNIFEGPNFPQEDEHK